MGWFKYSVDIQHQFLKGNTRRKHFRFLPSSWILFSVSSYMMKSKAVGSQSNKMLLKYAHNPPIQYKRLHFTMCWYLTVCSPYFLYEIPHKIRTSSHHHLKSYSSPRCYFPLTVEHLKRNKGKCSLKSGHIVIYQSLVLYP